MGGMTVCKDGNPINFEPYEPASTQKAKPKYTLEELKEAKTYIEQELEKRFSKELKTHGNVAKLMIEVYAIAILNAALGRTSGRKTLWDAIPETLQQTKLNAATYRSNFVWWLQMSGGGINIIAGLGSAAAMYRYKDYVNAIYGVQQGFNALGSLFGTWGQLNTQRLTGERTIGEGKVAFLNDKKSRGTEVAQNETRKGQEAFEQMNRAQQAAHDAFMRVIGG